jgi:hypothetical protein
MISNYELFHVVNTGAPRQDVYNHIARLPQPARIDFEEHTLAGNLILRIEPGLGGESETEAESKIVAIPYATRIFGNTTDAAEFIRCVKLIAGDEARAYNLQVIAAHYYQEARTRPVAEVLKEMALLALELSAVTATSETLCYEDVETARDEELAAAARRERVRLLEGRYRRLGFALGVGDPCGRSGAARRLRAVGAARGANLE